MSDNGAAPPRVLDLNALAREHPGTVIRIDPAEAMEQLGIGELAAAAEAARVPLDIAMSGSIDPVAGARFVLAIVWQLARRADPGLTWDDVQSWRIEQDEGTPDPLPDSGTSAPVPVVTTW